jgi:hypothetical protein
MLVVAFDRSFAELLEIITQINKKGFLVFKGYTGRPQLLQALMAARYTRFDITN